MQNKEQLTFDILIKDIDWLITVDKERKIIKDGAIIIHQDKIDFVGKTSDINTKYKFDKVIEANGKLVMPGMIDSHIHTTFQLSRGLADHVNTKEFLFERMYPYEASLDMKDIEVSTQLCILELLKNGITTFIDAGNYHPEITAKIAGESGLRSIVSRSNFDIFESDLGKVPEKFIEPIDFLLNEAENTVKNWNNKYNKRIKGYFQFRGLNNTSDKTIVNLKKLADSYGVGIHTHACFSEDTVIASLKKFGCREIERLNRLHVLDSNLILVHVGWATDEELDLLSKYDVKVVAAPSSSFHNGYGNFQNGKIPELLEKGLKIGLGSDHACSGIVDILQEMFLVNCGYKESRRDPKIMPVEKTIEMVTIGGACCAQWESEIGSIEVGKKADIVIFNTKIPEWQPIYNPLSNLVYSATGRSVETVIIDGNIVLEKGKAIFLNEEDIYQNVTARIPWILKKTGLEEKITSSWPII